MNTCDHCDRPAIYHDTRVLQGVTKTVSLCEDHARECGIDIGPDGISISLNPEMMGFSFTPSVNTCPDCGMTLAIYK